MGGSGDVQDKRGDGKAARGRWGGRGLCAQRPRVGGDGCLFLMEAKASNFHLATAKVAGMLVARGSFVPVGPPDPARGTVKKKAEGAGRSLWAGSVGLLRNGLPGNLDGRIAFSAAIASRSNLSPPRADRRLLLAVEAEEGLRGRLFVTEGAASLLRAIACDFAGPSVAAIVAPVDIAPGLRWRGFRQERLKRGAFVARLRFGWDRRRPGFQSEDIGPDLDGIVHGERLPAGNAVAIRGC
jgi:hypothetical protein